MDFLPQLTLNPPSGQLIPTESNHAGPSPGWWKPISLPHLPALHPVRLEQAGGWAVGVPTGPGHVALGWPAIPPHLPASPYRPPGRGAAELKASSPLAHPEQRGLIRVCCHPCPRSGPDGVPRGDPQSDHGYSGAHARIPLTSAHHWACTQQVLEQGCRPPSYKE